MSGLSIRTGSGFASVRRKRPTMAVALAGRDFNKAGQLPATHPKIAALLFEESPAYRGYRRGGRYIRQRLAYA